MRQVTVMRWVAALAWLLTAAWAAGAPSAALQVSERTMFVGQNAVLEVRVQGATDVSPTAFTISGFQLGSPQVSRQSSMTFDGRETRREEVVAYRYQMVPLEEGTFTIGPVTVMADGQRVQTNAVVVQVTPPQATEGVIIDVAVSNPNPYVGEPIELDITVLSDRRLYGGNFQAAGIDDAFEVYEAYPSQNADARTQDYGWGGVRTVSVSGIMRTSEAERYAVIMKRVLVPRRAGTLTLGPVLFTGEQEFRRSRSIFDSGTRTITAPSEALRVNVKPLPTEGQPANFDGLVGRYDVFASAMPQRVSVGEPIELTVLVKGGAARRLIDLHLSEQPIAEDFKLPDRIDAPVVDDSGQRFTVTIRALRDDVEAVPAVELPYFDVEKGAYEVARSRPIPLAVAPAAVVDVNDLVGAGGVGPSAREVESALEGIAHNYEGEAVLRMQGFSLAAALSSPGTLALVAGPPVAYALVAGVVVVSRRRERDVAGRRRREAAEALETVRRASGEGAASTVSQAMYAYVAAWCGRAAAGLTPRECEALLRERGVDEGEASAFRAVLERCDAARFGGLDAAEAGRLQSDAAGVMGRVDEVMRRRR